MAIIYMAQGANGLFKVGMTSALSSRKNTLKKEFSKRGDVLTKIEPIAEVKDDFARSVEYRLIGYVRDLGFTPCSGREWFRGVAFDDIKVKAPQVIKEAIRFTKRFYKTPQEWEEIKAERKREALAAEEARRVWRAEAEAKARTRRLIRAGSHRCFEYIACAALDGMSSLDMPTLKKAPA